MKYILGLNKDSHDAGVALLSVDGASSIIVPNERITRRKHDGGDTAAAVQHALEAAGASLEDIVAVCANNHHHRIAPFEKRLPWSVDLGLYPASCMSEHNLLPGVPRSELSHHLAHAWSVLAQAPFDEGLVVVMDGMGETHEAMARHHHGGGASSDPYAHDLQLRPCERAGYVQVPRSLHSHVGYREAESVYSFRGRDVRKVFKRWVPIRSPPELYNHGFENLESLGALYSRVSSHLFGDWNACGKVMGLGPWATSTSWCPHEEPAGAGMPSLLTGMLEADHDDPLEINWDAIEELPHANRFKETMAALDDGSDATDTDAHSRRAFYTRLASRVQTDLEDSAISFLQRLQERTGETNLCFVGGVAQNSVLNGRICRESGFTNVFIPPSVGDEGIPLGCALYAQHVMLPETLGIEPPPLRTSPMSAYQGKEYSKEEVKGAIEEFAPWLEVVQLDDEDKKEEEDAARDYAVKALMDGEVIAWFDGKGEVGARALGHRSILADPSRPDILKRVNTIKQREQWRPLAPSILSEHADEWFDGVPSYGSPYMSVTASVRAEKRETIPAVTHIDGSARLQTVDKKDAPLYYALILAFFALSGIPIVLNTSFNLAGMPIVESPSDAISCFLDANPDLSLLVLDGTPLRRKAFPSIETLPNETPRQQRAFTARSLSDAAGEPLRVEVLVEEEWLPLTDALELEILERCGDGATVAALVAELSEETGGDVEEGEVIARLEHLYGLRLISFA